MKTGAARVRTLIVDDEPLARRRLRTMLADQPDLEIVGEAANGTAAVHAIVQKRPDLLLLDIQMPGKDGFEVLREIAGTHQPVVVFITAHDEHAIQAFDVQAVDCSSPSSRSVFLRPCGEPFHGFTNSGAATWPRRWPGCWHGWIGHGATDGSRSEPSAA